MRWITNILGNLNTENSFVIQSTFLHFSHLNPQLSNFSGEVNEAKHSYTDNAQPEYLYAFLGIETEISIKLSNVRLLWPHFWHVNWLHIYPSKRSDIIESSLALKYLAQISDYSSIGLSSQLISWYFGFEVTRFSSSCIPSSKNLRNS